MKLSNEKLFTTMSIPAPESKNYVFKYHSIKNLVSGYKPAYTDLAVIKVLNIAELCSEEDVRMGWIKFTNERHDKTLNTVNEAKWVLRFPKGSPSINRAWKILVELVQKDVLWDIKASAKNDRDTQVICVYAADDKNIQEMVKVYDILLKNGLIDLHMAEAINAKSIAFITDEDTRLRESRPTYTHKDIEDLHKLLELKDTVSEEMFNSKWAEFSHALECQKTAIELPVNYRPTYFSDSEVQARQALLIKINQHQHDSGTSSVPVLHAILQDIRSTLTCNYKFTMTELLQHGENLLRGSRPKQNALIAVFNRNVAVKKYDDAINCIGLLINDEINRSMLDKASTLNR